tara:strand:- start:64 stop:483 length:420 start_codon:yes stop_codon:yes gene_type:complete
MDYLRIPGKSSISWDDNVSGLCPHCHEELELDISLIDWAKSQDTEFECPHCGGEFDWKEFGKWKGLKSEFKWIFGNPRTWTWNHRPFWLLSLMFILAGGMGMGTGTWTMGGVLLLVVSLAVLLFTTFIEIRNLVSRLSK